MDHPIRARVAVALQIWCAGCAAVLLTAGTALAQNTPAPPAVGGADAGVIRPPTVDPAIRAMPPATASDMPVIVPPATSGGNTVVVPK